MMMLLARPQPGAPAAFDPSARACNSNILPSEVPSSIDPPTRRMSRRLRRRSHRSEPGRPGMTIMARLQRFHHGVTEDTEKTTNIVLDSLSSSLLRVSVVRFLVIKQKRGAVDQRPGDILCARQSGI